MCDPIVGTGLALSVGAGLLGASQKSNYDNAVRRSEMDAYLLSRDARLKEQERQKVFEQEAADQWQDTAALLTAPQMVLDEQAAQQSFMDTLTGMPNGSPQGFLLSGQENASDEIKAEIARRTGQAAQEARARVEALAKLSGQDTAGAGRAAALGENADFLSTLNGLRRGSLSVSGFEQTIPAEYVAPPDPLFTDILSGVGGTLVGARMPGGFLGATGGLY